MSFQAAGVKGITRSIKSILKRGLSKQRQRALNFQLVEEALREVSGKSSGILVGRMRVVGGLRKYFSRLQ